MKRYLKPIALLFYYLVAKRFPTQPVPGYRIGYSLRRFLVKYIFEECGSNVIVKQNAYFGKGIGIKVGDNSQIGERSFIGAYTKLGRDVIMAPDVVIWSVYSGPCFSDNGVRW